MKQLFWAGVIGLCIVVGIVAGCTDAGYSKLAAYGNPCKIEMYSGGQLVRTWTSTGRINSEENSDGYYFMDAETRALVTVTGDIVITTL